METLFILLIAPIVYTAYSVHCSKMKQTLGSSVWTVLNEWRWGTFSNSCGLRAQVGIWRQLQLQHWSTIQAKFIFQELHNKSLCERGRSACGRGKQLWGPRTAEQPSVCPDSPHIQGKVLYIPKLYITVFKVTLGLFVDEFLMCMLYMFMWFLTSASQELTMAAETKQTCYEGGSVQSFQFYLEHSGEHEAILKSVRAVLPGAIKK